MAPGQVFPTTVALLRASTGLHRFITEYTHTHHTHTHTTDVAIYLGNFVLFEKKKKRNKYE